MDLKDWITHHFYAVQLGLGAFFVLLLFRRNFIEHSKSQFRVREADRGLKFSRGEAAADLAKAKLKPTPFQLTGIRLEGSPHEILGVSIHASEAEIQKAYKDLIKRYHPDKIGRPGTREWQDAQQIAEALNQARVQMLARRKRDSSA